MFSQKHFSCLDSAAPACLVDVPWVMIACVLDQMHFEICEGSADQVHLEGKHTLPDLFGRAMEEDAECSKKSPYLQISTKVFFLWTPVSLHKGRPLAKLASTQGI